MTTNRGRPSEHGISRQTFLRGAVGVLATGAMFGTTRASADPAAAPAGWNGLASTIGGRILLPNSGAQFASGKQVFNSLYNNSTPAAIVTVSSQADVQKAISFATANNLKIAPRGGGHSYVGASTAKGAMVIDLRGLPGGANLDGGNLTVTSATNLFAVQQACAAAGRAIPTGSCPTVGIGGLTLGGGLGADSRHAGLACDALQSATVVLPSGDVVTASANDHPDLFWALRGGGGGNGMRCSGIHCRDHVGSGHEAAGRRCRTAARQIRHQVHPVHRLVLHGGGLQTDGGLDRVGHPCGTTGRAGGQDVAVGLPGPDGEIDHG
ncbi:MAG TPA: FAD-dependent oxidoreductase, partial [Mycobacterium sp.]